MLANRIRNYGGRRNPLSDISGSNDWALTYGIYYYAAPPGGQDERTYGRSFSLTIGSIFPTSFSSKCSLIEARERLYFTSDSGGYTGLYNRSIEFKLQSTEPLEQDDITSIICPTGSQVLTSASADSFSWGGGYGTWLWTVTLGTDTGYPTHMGSGTFTVVVP